jgi:hypothetical protein
MVSPCEGDVIAWNLDDYKNGCSPNSVPFS